ncbi:MAG: ribonuclease III [Cyanobacteria bacterium RI_101]|nr:ribonuclease III [Cyanobacteria bacterium RI_101]
MALTPPRQKQLRTLLQKLGLPPTAPVDWELLDLALTHPSVSPEKNYQQLEFTGDAALRLAAAEVLMEKYPDAPVGELAALRSIMVSDRLLAQWADLYHLERYLWISASALSNSAGRASRLADAFEALLGALYLSVRNMSLVRPWLDEHLERAAQTIRQDPARQNYKDALQEWSQGRYKCLPEYQVEEIPAPAAPERRFRAKVWVQGELLGDGAGSSKKSAEQAAAKAAFYAHIQPRNGENLLLRSSSINSTPAPSAEDS